MTALDNIKAVGVAVLLMVLNVAAAFGVMWVWGTFIEPGHDQAFYVEAAQRIAPWSSIFVGSALFFAAGWLFAKRRPERNGIAFAATFTLVYVAIDVSIIIAAASLAGLSSIVAASIATKLGFSVLGAWLARPKSAPPPA